MQITLGHNHIIKLRPLFTKPHSNRLIVLYFVIVVIYVFKIIESVYELEWGN